VEIIKVTDDLEDLDINGKIILKWTSEKHLEGVSWSQCDLGQRLLVSSCEYGNELLGSIKVYKLSSRSYC
jgi:hypothetical protein